MSLEDEEWKDYIKNETSADYSNKTAIKEYEQSNEGIIPVLVKCGPLYGKNILKRLNEIYAPHLITVDNLKRRLDKAVNSEFITCKIQNHCKVYFVGNWEIEKLRIV